MNDQLQALRLFVQVARTGSFSKGAREMKLSQPTASRVIAQLEEQLGTTLFLRSTRGFTVTEAGADYLARVLPILASLEEAEHAIRGSGELRGTLRVALTSVIASRAIVPRLGAFIARHPRLRVELVVDDRRQDLIQEGIDVAIRFGPLPDSSAVARRVGRWPLVVVASPAYVEAHGVPGSPEALATHAFVLAGPVAGRELAFRQGERVVRMQPAGQLAIDSAEVAVSAVRAGLGLAVASLPSFGDDLASGALVRVLADWDLGEIEAHALFASGQSPKPAARAFVDHLVDDLRSAPWGSR